MKNLFRPRAAVAAVLLACAGGAFVAPASAHVTFTPHHHSPQELIQRFELVGTPQPGAMITFRMVGMPGGNARVHVPHSNDQIQMTEVQPGVYETKYMITLAEDPRNALAATVTTRTQGEDAMARVGGSGTLFAGAAVLAPDGRVAAIGEQHRAPPPPPQVVQPAPRVVQPAPQVVQPGRDSRGPDIGNVFPGNGERVSERGRTRISAEFRDDRAGVDPRSVRLVVDGRDVTRDSRLDDGGIEYRDDLRPGRHTADLTVRDRAGNLTRRTWTFDVVDSRPGRGWGDRNHEHERRDESRW